MKDEPIKIGDHVILRHLPSSMCVTPILVTDVAPNGMIQLSGRGWFQPYLLRKKQVPRPCIGRRPIGWPRKTA